MEESKEKEFKLIQDILDGQQDRYRILVDRYASMVFSIVGKFANRQAEREELAQQIFVKAYERLDSFKKQSKFSSWLYTLARNHCLDYAKNIRRLNKEFGEMESEELVANMKVEDLPDDDIEKEEEKAILNKALSVITPIHAEAFLMKYRDNMTYKAMAKRLDANEGALKVRVHRARKELKDYINQYN
ncbi:RNA polymerase subunit sigma-70 [Aliifodinibius salipaludis]|uniref:RNA polymerase subunit sigma-70 n=1 Tax=Fodinibius salipaludis TaxID=2032627 RepID=A0A2A2G7A8_9BACT|nr:sigma-70 family RNA polymerase sigma factor [Aliifodinibius salipaludis]PAU92735.1 RNA polymerase subunit sigma-70 [Aliifodinibius salipaludis]